MSPEKIERRICLIAGFCVMVFVMALIWRNLPFASPDLARMARIILSLGVGVLGGTIPGFLKIEYSLQGFAVRAGGALALFVITFFGSPHVEMLNLKSPEIRISAIPQIDIRTRSDPSNTDEVRLNSPAVVTVPISARNISQPSLSGYLESSRVEIRIDDVIWKFDWNYFVNMNEEAFGVWLAIQESVSPQALKSGEVINKEILYASGEPIQWDDILKIIRSSRADFGELTVYYTFDKAILSQVCKFEVAKWGVEIEKFVEKTGRMPGRLTMNCVA